MKKHKGKPVTLWVNGKEIIGIGSWELNTIPWYLRWWYWWKTRKIYRKNLKEKGSYELRLPNSLRGLV